MVLTAAGTVLLMLLSSPLLFLSVINHILARAATL